MKPLRQIIVDATSEMLDEPGEHGIYKTTRFYDRLEAEVQDYIDHSTDPFYKMIMATIEKAEHLNPNLQNVIAKYLDYQSHPKMTIEAVKHNLFGGKE